MPSKRYIFGIVLCVIFCELFADFLTLWSCSWPSLEKKDSQDGNSKLDVMILADPHLLGPVRGHWLDKLYREWHMRRAFQAAVWIHKPDVIFVLGDLFDEGDIVGHKDFNEFVRRFRSHFHAPASVPVISAVGNHDVGFHYKMHPYFVDRFEKEFNNTGVQMYTIKGNHFIVINSMAMEGDGCELCKQAVIELKNVAGKLNCLKEPNTCKDKSTLSAHKFYSHPIILQHFPTYHTSTKSCIEHDFPQIEDYREKWEVLSLNATDLLGKLLQPRLAFAGHSHHYCYFKNRWDVDEYTVASFSWRNKINPSFLMVSVNPTTHVIHKCNMLHQETVSNTYFFVALACASLIVWNFGQRIRCLFQKRNNSIKKN